MPYKRKTAYAGKFIEETKYHSFKHPPLKGTPAMPRRNKNSLTTAEQQKVNERMAEENLRLLIMENFKSDDYYLTLTYAAAVTPEECKEAIRNFIRRLSYFYKKRKVELKYIVVTEYRPQLHHHVLINQEFILKTKDLKMLWPQGFHKRESYQGEAIDAKRIASYFVKEERAAYYLDNKVFKRRWTPSRNLRKPKVKKKVIASCTWQKAIKPPKGYYLDKSSIRQGFTVFGYPYQFYRFIRCKDDDDDKYTGGRKDGG